MSQDYTAKEIQVLEGLEAVRKRPGMYIGSTSKKGLHHLIWETIDNSIDEFLAGFGEKIIVKIKEGEIISVRDFARGIPVDTHEKMNKPAAEVIMTTLHAGGKFSSEGYKFSGGLHGVGVSVVNALSEWLELEIHRDGNVYKQRYEKGKKVNELTKEGKSKENGTKITFKADGEIFDTEKYEYDIVATRLKQSAFLNKNLKFILKDERKEEVEKEEFVYSGGIKEYIKELNKKEKILDKKMFYVHKEFEDSEVEVAFQYNKSYKQKIYTFANNINTGEGGYHLTGFKSAMTRAFNKYAEEENFFKKSDPKPNGKDYREGITAIISVKVAEPEFEGQTKTKLGNNEMRKRVSDAMYEELEDFLRKNPKLSKAIVEKALNSAQARKAAKEAKKVSERKSVLKNSTLPTKLADCSSKKAKNSELFIVEGDSAGGSAKQGRDRNIQAILALKGKVLNTYDRTLTKVVKNNEINSIIKSLGCGIGKSFDIDNLRYERIIIMTDADVDGAHITTLVLTFFYKYYQELIKNEHLYIACSPLYKVQHGKKKHYIYSKKELEEFFKGRDRSKYSTQRFKGLGEMNPNQLWDTTMNPENRKLEKVTIEDAILADETFETLMGKSAKARKEFIFQKSNLLKNEIEV